MSDVELCSNGGVCKSHVVFKNISVSGLPEGRRKETWGERERGRLCGREKRTAGQVTGRQEWDQGGNWRIR